MHRALPTFVIPLIAACSIQAATGGGLDRTSWRFVTIDGEAPSSHDATLNFNEQGITANVGCNGMGGQWRIDSGRLLAGPLMQTQMFCDGKVWDQERATSALIVAAPTVSFEDGKLVLQSSGHRAVLERIN